MTSLLQTKPRAHAANRTPPPTNRGRPRGQWPVLAVTMPAGRECVIVLLAVGRVFLGSHPDRLIYLASQTVDSSAADARALTSACERAPARMSCSQAAVQTRPRSSRRVTGRTYLLGDYARLAQVDAADTAPSARKITVLEGR